MMNQSVFVEEFETPKHSEEQAALNALALEFHRANVSLILQGASEVDQAQKQLIRVASSHILSAVNTLVSIMSLTEKLSLKVKEAIALSRVFYETTLVAAFTCVGGPERARRAELYSVYKTFRNQTQVQQAGSHILRIERSPRLSRNDPLVAAALEMFGGSSGIRPCFTEGRVEMLEQINQLNGGAGILFGGVEGMIHDVSSEIIHGSFHGYALFNSLHNNKSDVVENLSAHYEMVFFSVCLSIAALARVLAQTCEAEGPMQKLERLCIASLISCVPDEMASSLRVLYPE